MSCSFLAWISRTCWGRRRRLEVEGLESKAELGAHLVLDRIGSDQLEHFDVALLSDTVRPIDRLRFD